MDWYYAEDENRIGPLSDERFRGLIKGGTITDETLVWHEGMAEWEPYASAAQQSVAPAPYVGDEPVPPIGYAVDRTDAAQTDISGLTYGGFWIRLVAKVFDNFITGFAGFIVQIPLLLVIGATDSTSENMAVFGVILSFLVSIAVPATYSTWFIGRFGATPGKMILGLKVVRSDGTSLTYGRAFDRYVSEILSGLTLLIGYIIAAFDVEKRTLHDHICDTRVIVSRR